MILQFMDKGTVEYNRILSRMVEKRSIENDQDEENGWSRILDVLMSKSVF